MNAARCIGGQHKKKIYLNDNRDNGRGKGTAKQIVRLKGDKNIPAAMRMIERL